jgi:hypothetical protein
MYRQYHFYPWLTSRHNFSLALCYPYRCDLVRWPQCEATSSGARCSERGGV